MSKTSGSMVTSPTAAISSAPLGGQAVMEERSVLEGDLREDRREVGGQ